MGECRYSDRHLVHREGLSKYVTSSAILRACADSVYKVIFIVSGYGMGMRLISSVNKCGEGGINN